MTASTSGDGSRHARLDGSRLGSAGRVLPGSERLVPTADRGGQALRLRRPPGALVVEANRRWVIEHPVADPPLLLDGVGPAEAAVVALHGILEEPLVRLRPVPEDLLVADLEVDRPGLVLVAG